MKALASTVSAAPAPDRAHASDSEVADKAWRRPSLSRLVRGRAGASTGALSRRTAESAQQVLHGRRSGLAAVLPFAGPAIIASVAYVDPGNLAINFEAGARHGYELLWVIAAANLIAMLLQSLSAKVGIVTGRNLAELSRDYFPRPVVWPMWVVSEIAAMATDLAEFIGGAIGCSLLLHVSMLTAMAITGIATWMILALQRRGFRPLEMVIAALVAVIGLSYLAEIIMAPPAWGAAAFHTVVPQLTGGDAAMLAVGIIGATVMPHAIYLHSGLTQHRIAPATFAQKRRLIGFSNRETVAALGLAGLVNGAMIVMAASVFHAGGHREVGDLITAYRTLTPLLGGAAAAVFLISLTASGLSSSAVGTMAGQVVMQGFVGFRIPLWIRRALTMLPAFIVVAAGTNTMHALVISQIVLSLVLPVPMISLLMLSSRRDIMGQFANRRVTAIAATAATAVVIALNTAMLVQFSGIATLF